MNSLLIASSVGLGVGLAIGMIPFVLGWMKNRRSEGVRAIVACGLSGAVLGSLLAVPVCGYFIWRIVNDPVPDSHTRRTLRVAKSAGLGSAFAFLLWAAIDKLLGELSSNPSEAIGELAAILIVSIGICNFIEPLTERLKVYLRIGSGHSMGHECDPLSWSAVVVLAVASLSHGLLHNIVSQGPLNVAAFLVTAVGIPAGLTYGWALGARRQPSRAALAGAISGAIFGGGANFILFTVTGGYLLIGNEMMKFTLEDGEWIVMFNAIPWIMIGLVGGLAVDRHWGAHATRSVALAILASFAMAEILVGLSTGFGISALAYDWARAAGWALGLMIVEPSANAILRSEPQATSDVKALDSLLAELRWR
jgi:hypothetical protein